MIEAKSLKYELWEGLKSIACCIYQDKTFWVISSKDNFILDGEKELHAYIKKGHIQQSDFDSYTRAFRGGISHLTEHTFDKFMGVEGVEVVGPNLLKSIFFDVGLGDFSLMQQSLQNHFSFGHEFSSEFLTMRRAMASRLPKFYINFTRHVYLHMDWGRSHENLAYPSWYARCADFGYNLPVDERYWWSEKADFWPINYFSD